MNQLSLRNSLTYCLKFLCHLNSNPSLNRFYLNFFFEHEACLCFRIESKLFSCPLHQNQYCQMMNQKLKDLYLQDQEHLLHIYCCDCFSGFSLIFILLQQLFCEVAETCFCFSRIQNRFLGHSLISRLRFLLTISIF